jgi:hypothetical protein
MLKLSLALGIHNMSKEEYIKAHTHAPFENLSMQVQEIFFLEKGKISVCVYDGKEKIKEVSVLTGEIILLNCVHSIEFLEDTKMVEVKQGPYRQKNMEKIPIE